jgi:hypothetical protein
MSRIFLSSLFVLTVLTGCLKDELPVPARPRGEGSVMQVCMGPGYNEQLWVDVSSGTVVSSNPKTAWNLAFENGADGWRVRLNGSMLMSAMDLGAVDITAAHDTVGMFLTRHIDAPSGHPDSTAFGDWRGTGHVYLVDLGYDALGQQLGFRKVRFDAVDATSYTMQVAMLNGAGLQTIVVNKDASRSATTFHFVNGPVNVFPPMGTWDMVITQYTHQFYEPFLPYIVTGVLMDQGRTRVARIPDADIAQVTLNDTIAHPFSGRRDAIGYDWKTYSFETSSYTVNDRIVYIIQDAAGFYFKLRFLEFYSSTGQVGCPQFEVVPL